MPFGCLQPGTSGLMPPLQAASIDPARICPGWPCPGREGLLVCQGEGWRGWVCSGPLLRASPCPWCRLPWAGCRQAALSRPPSRTLHFSVCCETVAVINLTGALRAADTAQLVSLHQGLGAGAPSPSGSVPSTPALLRAVLLSTPGSGAAPRTAPLLPEMFPCPKLGVWCWAPACRGISQGFCLCRVLSAPNQCLLLVPLRRR